MYLGYRGSARATEPQVPEGETMLALRILKACLVLPPGMKQKIEGGNMMKISKRMGLGALLAAMLLLIMSTALVATVNAQVTNGSLSLPKEFDIQTLDKKEETPVKEIKDKESIEMLSKILNKDTLKENDYIQIRQILEKMVNRTLSDKEWADLGAYIDAERAKKNWFLKQKETSKATESVSILSTNPYDHVPIPVQQYPDLFGATLYEGLNYVDEVFYKSNGLKTIDGVNAYEFEYTLVFRDEDAPPGYDTIYDAIRYANWGRYEDIETYYLYVYQSGTPWKFYFYYGSPVNNGIYSGDSTYYTLPGPHNTATVLWSAFSKNGNRPYLWVNTWNHAFGERDNNPDLSNWQSSFTTTQGSRVNAEVKYSDCAYSPFC